MLALLSINVTGIKRRKSTIPHSGYRIKKLTLFFKRNLAARTAITIIEDVIKNVAISPLHPAFYMPFLSLPSICSSSDISLSLSSFLATRADIIMLTLPL